MTPPSGSTADDLRRERDHYRDALRAVIRRLTAADGVSLAQGNAAALTARTIAETALKPPGRKPEFMWPFGRCMECEAHHNRRREAVAYEGGGGFPMCKEHLNA